MITNGGLETTSSNSSPATGSSREPRRRLTRASRSAGSRCSCAGVEQQVEAGERQGAVRDVRGGHVLSVVQQVEGLDAAAGAEVQRPGHVPAGGDLHQGGGGLPDPEHVVVAQDARALVGGEVAGHPEFRPAAADRRSPLAFSPGRLPRRLRPSRTAADPPSPGPGPSAAGSTRPSSSSPCVRTPGRAASSVAAGCGSASSQRRTTAASAAVVGSPWRAASVTISAGTSWSRPRALCAAGPRSPATPSTV